jgi:hypothetical protein
MGSVVIVVEGPNRCLPSFLQPSGTWTIVWGKLFSNAGGCMYSIVLMMAMSGQATEAPAGILFHRHEGCCGCTGHSACSGYGCSGACSGYGCSGHSACSGYGCSGACYGGCTGYACHGGCHGERHGFLGILGRRHRDGCGCCGSHKSHGCCGASVNAGCCGYVACAPAPSYGCCGCMGSAPVAAGCMGSGAAPMPKPPVEPPPVVKPK